MNFTRTENVILYTCTILFGIMLFYVFYRVFQIAWRKLLALLRPPSLDPQETRQERRVRELLQRPTLRDLLATRAEFVQDRQRRHDSDDVRRLAAAVSQKPGGGDDTCDINVNGDRRSLNANTTSNECGLTDGCSLPPPAYDSLSMHSGPPPSYYSEDFDIGK